MSKIVKVAGLPVKARLYRLDSWTVTRKESTDIRFVLSRDRVGNLQHIDVWTVREEFLEVRTAGDARRFFRKFGPLQIAGTRTRELPDSYFEREEYEITLAQIKRFRGWFLDFIRAESPGWRKPLVGALSKGHEANEEIVKHLALSYESPRFLIQMGIVKTATNPRTPAPYLEQRSFDVFSAVYASIYIDKMRGLRGAVCAREDCQRTFLALDPRRTFCYGVDGKGDCGAVMRARKARGSGIQSSVSSTNHQA